MPVTTEAVSLLANTEYEGLITGIGSPYVTVGLEAVTVINLREMATEPAVYENV